MSVVILTSHVHCTFNDAMCTNVMMFQWHLKSSTSKHNEEWTTLDDDNVKSNPDWMKRQPSDLLRWLVPGKRYRWRGGCSNSAMVAAPLASWHRSMPRARPASTLKGSTTASNSRKINSLLKPLSDELATLRNVGTEVEAADGQRATVSALVWLDVLAPRQPWWSHRANLNPREYSID